LFLTAANGEHALADHIFTGSPSVPRHFNTRNMCSIKAEFDSTCRNYTKKPASSNKRPTAAKNTHIFFLFTSHYAFYQNELHLCASYRSPCLSKWSPQNAQGYCRQGIYYQGSKKLEKQQRNTDARVVKQQITFAAMQELEFMYCTLNSAVPWMRAVYHSYLGLARTVYIGRMWSHIWSHPCQKYRIYTVHI